MLDPRNQLFQMHHVDCLEELMADESLKHVHTPLGIGYAALKCLDPTSQSLHHCKLVEDNQIGLSWDLVELVKSLTSEYRD